MSLPDFPSSQYILKSAPSPKNLIHSSRCAAIESELLPLSASLTERRTYIAVVLLII